MPWYGEMNRIDRLTGTILLLQTRRRVTVEELAGHWEVSERTVFRDLAALGEMGLPIGEAEGGGYRLVGNFALPPLLVDEDEAAALALAAAATEEIADVAVRRALRSALTKIQAVLPKERREAMARLREVVGVWLCPGGPSADAALLPIRRAILDRTCLEFVYLTGGHRPGNRRKVEPLGLLYYAGHWHLLAFCRWRRDFRDFRLDRVEGLTVCEDRFSGHETFSIRTHLAGEIARSEKIPVRLKVAKAALDRFRRELVGTLVAETGGSREIRELSILVPSLEGLACWLPGFGAGVEVCDPPALRARLRATAQAMVRIYSDGLSDPT
ncbi:MAG: YafY family transcriptional regulator [Opitutales bacterium]|nr:YafY family transcriptional regulator [Opitutales bacterium]